jgi:ferredoxin-like protein FixX
MADVCNIGKAKIRIEVEGCIDCGTRWSSGWTLAKQVPLQIGKRTLTIDIHRCADCGRERHGGSDGQAQKDDRA